jgi:alanine dehydrogenase
MMVIGVPREIKTDEFRVGATPANVAQWVAEGCEVHVQRGAGVGSGFEDKAYERAGAVMHGGMASLYRAAELIVKVKEPQPDEYPLLDASHTLFCYIHLAPLKALAEVLMQKKVTVIAYETVAEHGELPLLKPMSEIAGKMAALVGAHHLNRYQGGSGILVGGAAGVLPARVLVIGAGNAGYHAARVAAGMGADVTVLNRTTPKLLFIEETLGGVDTALYTPEQLEMLLPETDIVVSSVLIHGGAKAPKLISREMLASMKEGSVLVDIAIDQGGTAVTSRPTTHREPTFVEEGVIHYCVANMPGAYPRTSTIALTNATSPYVIEIAKNGMEGVERSSALREGLNVYRGRIVREAVAEGLGVAYTPLEAISD